MECSKTRPGDFGIRQVARRQIENKTPMRVFFDSCSSHFAHAERGNETAEHVARIIRGNNKREWGRREFTNDGLDTAQM